MSELRSTKDGPFCYQIKAVRRRIRDAFDATNNVTTALAVYDALTEIASDKQAEIFQTTHYWIGMLSGVSIRTIQSHLKTFCDLGLIRVSTPRVKAPSTYELLPFSNGCATSGNGCTTFGNHSKQGQLPTSEESIEESLKNEKEEAGSTSADDVALAHGFETIPEIPIPKTVGEVTAFALKQGVPEAIARKWIKVNEHKGWKTYDRVRKCWRPIRNWHHALLSFVQIDLKRPKAQLDKLANADFWAFVETFPQKEEAKEAARFWITLNDKKGWRRTNPMTGQSEPVQDFRTSFRGFYEKTWVPSGGSNSGLGDKAAALT